jgi:mono/diheme cytochrome c family protein
VTDNQLDTLDRYGYFTSPQPGSASQPTLVDVSDPSADLGERARAWLHSNCSTCHRPGGPTPASMDLRYTTALSATSTCDAQPSSSLGIANAVLIAPGEPDRSVLLSRMSRRDEYGMPPLGSNIVDDAGIAIVSDWISGLADCN